MPDFKTYAADLKGVEIFSAGVWNNDPYTTKDLDALVEAFPKMPRLPPLKLGHTEAQKFFGQADGHPALGWIEKVYRSGEKLLADFKGVPEVLAGMIRNRNYSRVSSEIYWNFKKADGEVLPRALKAVALLGADMPAVSNLQDLQTALLGEADRDVRAYGQEESEIHRCEIEMKEDHTMEVKQYEEKIASLTADLATSREETKTAVARAEKAEKESLDAAVRVFSLEVDGLVRHGKVLPAEVAGLVEDFRAMGAAVRKYTEGGKEIEKTWGDRKLDELKARPKLVEFEEKAQGGEEDPKKESGESFGEAVQKAVNERKCTYSEAQEIVRVERPDLFKAYVNRKEDK